MRRTILSSLFVTALLAGSHAAFANPGQPNFMPALWGDGELWGTKGTTVLPAPNRHNPQSFDKLFVITNSTAPGQLPVAESAPGNPYYNGGRWLTYAVTWNDESMSDTLLTSYDDIMDYADDLTIAAGSPGGPPSFFQCPLLPVMDY